ncbi:MAG: hypothetical protein HQK76_20680 [Desulfobacterales bacterium]|nr:hypothetical protein [Desulfobacterales bacterium]
MAIFKIFFSRPKIIKDFNHHPEFDIQLISGSLKAGDRFCLYETHHDFWFTVLEVKKGTVLTIVVDRSISYFNWHKGTIVDTENSEAGRKFGYRTRDAQRLYHPSVLNEKATEDSSTKEAFTDDSQEFQEAYEKALKQNEQFESQLYEAHMERKKLRIFEQTISEAYAAFSIRNYKLVVQLLEPFENELTDAQHAKLDYARRKNI